MTTDKVAIVTAGGSGMGAGAARRLASHGCKVAVLSSSGKGEALAEELGGIGVTGSNQSTEDLVRLIKQDQWHVGTMHAFCGKYHALRPHRSACRRTGHHGQP